MAPVPHLSPLEAEQLDAFAALEDALDNFNQPACVSPDAPAPFAQYTSLVGRSITSPSGGRFRLAFRRVLGVGAYGVVYLAEEMEQEEPRYALFNPAATRRERQPTITAGRMFAVKVMRCAPPGSRQRAFQAREVALHRRADGHPGVVPLHAVYGTGAPPTWSPRKRKAWSSRSLTVRREDELTWDRDAELSGGPLPILENGFPEELVYMVLSYVDDGDLFTMVAERQRYIGDDHLVRHVFLQLLDAVQWCHERGVRHRDLKPENVLCEEDGRTVFISDFGLATMDEYSRDYGCGSSYYMSPECYGDPLAPATCPSYDTRANDIWTLGIVLVNLTTGRNPWEAASPMDPTFASFCADPANFLLSILPITPAANEVFVRVFERDQSRRCSISELRQLVLRVQRWTLRGSELDSADEGARDVARGCGLLDAPVTVDVEMERAGSAGSAGMMERSRFSEDSILDDDTPGSYEEELSVLQWYGYGHGSGRALSSTSSSSEMNRSRPVSKILSNSPTMVGPEQGDIWGVDRLIASEDGPGPDHSHFVVPGVRESIPRWPKIVQGWEEEVVRPQTPPAVAKVDTNTPRALVGMPKVTVETPRIQVKATTPRTTPRGNVSSEPHVIDATLRAPRSTPSLRAPRSNPTLQTQSNFDAPPGLSASSFASKIPRYTGSPRTRTVSFEPPSRLGVKEDIGRERMRSAPGPGPLQVRPKMSFGELSSGLVGRLRGKASGSPLHSRSSTRELSSKASFSTLSAASSESSGFPGTPLKAEVMLSSPRLIISHPSESKLWDVPRSSGSSCWDTSSSSSATFCSGDAPIHRLEPGAPLYDSTARLVDPRGFYGSPSLGMSSPSLSVEGLDPPRWGGNGGGSPGSTIKRKIKRVPVPPIPSDLLEEHERQLTLKRGAAVPRIFDISADSHGSKVPPPGLDDRTGRKRLLENARAWFRRI